MATKNPITPRKEPEGKDSGFIEKALSGREPARCVDGRPDPTSEQGPQMLGGSLHPILLEAISRQRDFDEETVKSGLSNLTAAGYRTGVHRGSHRHADEHGHAAASDCGFADRLREIFSTALSNRFVIIDRLRGVCSREALDCTFSRFMEYPPEKIKLTGEKLVALAKQDGANVENVEGDHHEETAFVNKKRTATLDTKKMNAQGRQAFNLDLEAAVEQAKALGVYEEFARTASLILYQATEIVLVETKGKKALPVVVHR